MGNDEKRNIALQLFHTIRIKTQTRERLLNKYREFQRDIDSMAEALTSFSIYRPGNILYHSDGGLWLIESVNLQPCVPADMRPIFSYEGRIIACKNRRGC